MKERIRNHKEICKGLTELYEVKNHKYGNSFETTFAEYGPTSVLIRLDDKINRAKTLLNNDTIDPGDESIRDTLMDLANYSIMSIMELDKSATEKEVAEDNVKEVETNKVEEALGRFTKNELMEVGESLGLSLPKKGSKASLINKLEKELPEKELLKALEELENSQTQKEEVAPEEVVNPKKSKKK